jgi:hypothetical protein
MTIKQKRTVKDGIKNIRDSFYGKRYLTVSEAASKLPYSDVSIRKFIRMGKIKAKNLSSGKRPTYIIAKSELIKLVPLNRRKRFKF